MKRSFLLILILIFSLTACEKTVNFNLDEVSPKLVIEATIENNQPPVVYLSNSLGYFSSIDQISLANNFVRNADVYVSNGTLTHKLKEYSSPVSGGYNFYYYSIDTANLATSFLGQLNTQYSLRVLSAGKEFTATTKIPRITRRIDSIFWKPAPIGNSPQKVALMISAFDPSGYGDFIRYFTKRNREIFYAGRNSVYDDQVIDGTSFTVQVDRGTDRSEVSFDDEAYFDKGDTVMLKLSNIDKATYEFWRTMEFSYTNVGNPFSSPTKVTSNIAGGGLGYFGGYASQYHTLIIPR